MKKWLLLLMALLLALSSACALAEDDECRYMEYHESLEGHDDCEHDDYCDECCPFCNGFIADYLDIDDDNYQYSPGWLHWPPSEVLEYVINKYSEHYMEDYCQIGSYGFALLRKDSKRTLVGFKRQDDEMKFWLKTEGAVPQGWQEAWFELTEEGRGFSVTRLDSSGESYEQGVVYRLRDGVFRLEKYWLGGPEVHVKDGYLEFWNKKKLGTVTGTVQNDLRYVALSTLPATLRQAQEKITVAPDLPDAQFAPKEIKFEGGKKYAVYTGPGKDYARSGNGKGSVSTNDWIQVFGKYGRWILIQYDISAEQYRIGWIEASALPKGADVATLDFGEALNQEYYQDVVVACELTDDPFNSKKPIAQLEVGHQLCEIVYDYEGWSYIVVEVDGKLMCGFVPSECISHG